MNRFKGKGIKSSFIVFIATIFLIAQSGMYSSSPAYADELPSGVTITAIDEDGEDVFETKAVSFEDEDTAFDALDDVAEVTYEDTDLGQFITGINENSPEEGYYWGFFVNGSTADVGAEGYELDHGDNLLFKVVDEDIWPHTTIDVKVSAVGLNDEEVLPETNVDIVKFGTAYDAILQATDQEGINLDVSVDSEFLTFINDLDDALDDSFYWGMYLNDDSMETGLVNYQMQEGDHLELIATELIDEDSGSDDSEGEQGSNDGKEESTNEEEVDEPESDNLEELTLEYIKQLTDESIDYLLSNDSLDWYGSITLNALKRDVAQQIAEDSIESVVVNEGEFRLVTDAARNILILTAAGKDATDIEGYNLIEKLTNHEGMTSQGNNGPIYSLLAINSGGYDTEDDATWSKDKLIEYLIEEQLDDGGWSLFGNSFHVDLTGMGLAALAPYQGDENIKTVIDNAAAHLSKAQHEDGGYPDPFHGGDSSPSIAMAITGLVSVGIDPTGEEFTTEKGVNLVERLLQFRNDDGGFDQNIGDDESNSIASNQSVFGLAAYYKFLNNDGAIFDFRVTGEDKDKEDEQEDQEQQDEGKKEEDEEKEEDKDVDVPKEQEDKIDEKEDDRGENVTGVIESSTDDKKDSTENNNDVDQDTSNENTEIKHTASGEELPDTATSNYTFIAIGIFMVIAGIMLVVFKRRLRVNL
ncbi:DUF4430 domain-containing protein [Alkalibacillus silvisoli]|uniref:DUF4430 domain-containing protein n=1 Tax=Alkalibacillus silvisoli TaxID=392823 RepID=A0ABN1A955_9BACI